MSLAIKKPLCCCANLRTASLILLYFQLIINVQALFNTASWRGYYSTPSHSQAWEITPSLTIPILLDVSSCAIFLVAIITIYKVKPSVNILTASVYILIVSLVYSCYVLIVWNSDGTLQKLLDAAIAQRWADEETRKYYERMPLVFWFNVIFICTCVFDLYSALIVHSYKQELKQKPAYGVPPDQHIPHVINASAPYPPNAQFVEAQYPTQHNQHFGSFPNYPNQPPQYPVPTQNYPQGAPYDLFRVPIVARN